MIIEGTEQSRERYSKGKRKTDVTVIVRCDECGKERRLTVGDARRAVRCQACAARAALKNVKEENRLSALRENFLQHMNNSEKMVASWLDEWGIPFKPQAILTGMNRVFIVDFLIRDDIVVEVNGWDHSNRSAIQARDELLMRFKGDKVIFLDAVHNLEAEYQRLKDYLTWML